MKDEVRHQPFTSYFLLPTSNFGIHRVSPDATADDHEDRRPGTNGAFAFYGYARGAGKRDEPRCGVKEFFRAPSWRSFAVDNCRDPKCLFHHYP